MKRMIRTLFLLLSSLFLHEKAMAFEYDPDIHMQVIYDFCGRDIVVTFVYHQSEGDDDRMLDLKFMYRPSSGADEALIDFRHLNHWPNDETGLDTIPVLNGIGASYAYKFPTATWPWNIELIDHWYDIVVDEQGARKYYVSYRLRNLPADLLQNFFFSGTWDGEGSNSPNFEFSSNNTFRTLSINSADAPSAFTASSGECGKVVLEWQNNESYVCNSGAYAYYFRILRKNLFLTDVPVPDISQQDFIYEDFVNPIGTTLPPNQYDYKIQLIIKKIPGNQVVQSSSVVGPVVGNPLPLPVMPNNLNITYPNCTGNFTLNWQNPQIYSSISVTKTPAGGAPITEIIAGTSTSFSSTIMNGVIYSVSVIGLDACNQPSPASGLSNVAVPQGPGSFTQHPPTITNGSYLISWTASAGATSYRITRIAPTGNTDINIDNGNTTSYMDADVQVCTPYSYRVRAINTCGGLNSATLQAPVIPAALDIWSDQSLTCSKGYYGNRVVLDWEQPNSLGFDHYKIYRKPLGSNDPETFLATVPKTELRYIDLYAQGGALYNYRVYAYSECNGQQSATTPLTDVGFRLPIATVTGNVKFENGTGVSDVSVTVERNEGSLGKSLYLQGEEQVYIHPDYAAVPAEKLTLANQMTIEIWIKPEFLGSDFTLFEQWNGNQGYGLWYDASEQDLIQYIVVNGVTTSKKYAATLSLDYFTHLSWRRHQNALSLFVNGTSQPQSPSVWEAPTGNVALTFGTDFIGYLDEIRWWNVARAPEDISGDYQQILRGDEPGLKAYWRIDEGIESGVYDISGIQDVFNAHHLRKSNTTSWSSVYPLPSQLGNLTRTDSVGNYIIKNIRYTNTGNTFTVIPFFSPGNTPHEFEPATTVLFMGEGNDIQNNVNFVDISSFKVTGRITYSLPDSICPSTKAFIYVDENVATRNGQPVFADANGDFEINVPIGFHQIKVAQGGHVFHHGGIFPPDGTLYDFQEEVSGIEFFDSTRVRVIGRVVGGTREEGKRLGFDDSKNNIGKAILTFTPQLFVCSSFTVETDSLSGEYEVDLLPIKYDVSISVPSNPSLTFGPQDVIDLSIIRPTEYVLDSVRNFAGQLIRVDSVHYNLQKNFIYRSIPDLNLTDAMTGGPLRGDTVFVYVDGITGDTTFVPLQEMPYPVFFSGKKYRSVISVYEPYFNYDDPDNIIEDRVPVTDAMVTIRNRMGNASGTGPAFDEKFDITSPDGVTDYTFFGGQPEFFIDPNPNTNRTFTQLLEMFLETPGHTVVWLPNGDFFRGYVLGSNPVEGSSFITEGPEMVDYILRDPPGDASTASFTEGETYTNTYNWNTTTKTTFETNLSLKLGMSYFFGGGIVGIGFDTEAENDNNLKITSSASINLDGEYTESTTFEQSISTSSDPFFPGDESDLFMGKSMNYLFGTSDELTLVNADMCNLMEACVGPEIMVNGEGYRLGKRKGVFMVPQGFKTTFIYSQWQIKNYLIPNLENLRNNLFVQQPNKYVLNSGLTADDPGFGLNNDDPFWEDEVTSDDPFNTTVVDFSGVSYTYNYQLDAKPDDRVRWYNQQIRLWKNALARNEEEKVTADLVRNISFDAGTSLSYSESSTNTSKYSEKIEVSIGSEAQLYFGAVFAGSGFEQAFTLGFEIVTGTGFSQENQNTNSYNYTLGDSQPGDFFSVDIKEGKFGNGPIFSLRGGQSMCPWEREYVTQYFQPGTQISISTIPRELPKLEVEPSFAANVPDHQPARFKVRMTNASPTGDIQWYRLKLLEETNPYGAQLSVDNGATNVDQVFEIPAGTTVEKTLFLYKDIADFYEMKVVLFSTCEYDAFQNGAPIYAIDTITISAQFVPACSEVNIHTPVDLWVHTDSDQDQIGIVVSDYNLDDTGLEKLQLQYKPSFTSIWKGIETFWVEPPQGLDEPQIPQGSSFFNHSWDIEELPDGPYDIRVVSSCNNTDNDYASPIVTGIVDRIRPHAFGNPQPADGVLDPNDEIMIQFNEIINPASVISSNFDVQAVLNGATLRHETSVQLDGADDYIEIPQGTRIGNESFTIELWVKRLSNGANMIWSQGEQADTSMALGFNASNQLYFRNIDQTIQSNATITADNQWYHIAVTRNANQQINFYITGVHHPGGTLAEFPPVSGNMVFGKAAWSTSGAFHGYMHEARIWRTELTEGVLRAQMLKKLSGVEAGLSMLWPLDEGTGTVLYERVRKKHAVLHGDWAILPSGKALTFGGNYLIDVDAGSMVFSHQTSFTLEFWMKGAANAGYQTLLSNGKGNGEDSNTAGWSISTDPSGNLIVVHGGQQLVVVDKNVLDNDWHHIALALNRQGNLNTYMDGLLQSSIFGDVFGEFGGPSLWIGNRGWYNGVVEMHDQGFTGAMDEIRVWNTRLTAEHIRALRNNRLTGQEFGLQLYLPFETYSESGGVPQLTASMFDQSPFDRDLTLSGPPQYLTDDPNIKLVAPFEKVNFTYSINGDKIIITPTTDPLRLERTILFISVDRVQDLYGNKMAGPINWTAFVNRNQLQWDEDELFFEKPEKEEMSFTTSITNSGGIDLSFEILGLPEWLSASPAEGSISPVSSKTIKFTINENVKIGAYSTDVNLISGQGYNDKLSIDLKVFGVPPAWDFDPAAFQNSMTIVADLDIQGELSEDPLDRIVAYVNGEVRGLATLEYIEALDQYIAFMDVYSHGASGEQITFKVWDASTGITYAGVNIKVGTQTLPAVPFVNNGLIGNAVTPARWIMTSDITQEIPLQAGWTWISFNVISPLFNNLNAFFSELNFENNDAIHHLTKSASYNPPTGWQGNLVSDGLSVTKMYKCDFTYADILRVTGPRVNPNNYPISIAKGWNWIPYLSIEPIEINEALSSYTATSGDIVKSQDEVAVYHPTQGWLGTLTQMVPGKGYMLFADKAGSIIYPLMAQPNPEVDYQGPAPLPLPAIQWRSGQDEAPVVPQQSNMTMVATLESEIPIEGAPIIAAFVAGQLLQVVQGIALAHEQKVLYYFTLQSDVDRRDVYFEIYDGQGSYVGLAQERILWDANLRLGSYEAPYVLHVVPSRELSIDVHPNPFSHALDVQIETDKAGLVEWRIIDGQGQLVFHAEEFLFRPGIQYLRWNGRGDEGQGLASGTYFLHVIFGDTVSYKKLIKM